MDDQQLTAKLSECQQEITRLKQDLQDYEQIIRELRRQVEDFENLFNALPIMVWQKDTHNRHVRISQAAADLEGTTRSAIEGKTAEELYPPAQAAAYYKDDLEVIQSGKPKLNILEKHVTAGTGKVTWLQTGKVPVRDRHNEVVGVVAFAVDITAQKEAEDALREVHRRLEEEHSQLTRAQELFQSTLEHLNEAVLRGAIRDELLQYLKQARAEFNALKRKTAT